MVGQFHQPRFTPALGTGEGAGGITEQFTFGQVLRECRTVQGQKGGAKTVADGMAGARDQFFTGTGLALDQ